MHRRLLISGVITFIALTSVGCQQARQVGDFGRNMVDYFTGNTALAAAKRMEDNYFPDERRVGINYLTARPYGRQDPYTERYEQVAELDSDWLVRATAVRALNRSRDAEAVDVYLKALGDQNKFVRLEAAKALANVPDERAVEPLTRVVGNENEDKDVRIAATGALRHYHTLPVARALVEVLDNRDFGVAWQANRSLRTLTGRDLRYDEAAWLEYITGPEKPFG
ncbi:MAG: HEAT repeat domain-containing protein [Tepidisphaeraceae bacterium]